VAEVVGGILWRKSSESFLKCRLKGDDGAGFESAQFLFHLCPTLLDGVEVRRIGRQKAEGSSGFLDQFSDTVHFVRSQVVHHDQLAGFQLRTKNVFQIGSEDIAIGGRLNGQDGHPTGNADRSQYGQGAPVASGNSFVNASAVECAAIASCHFRRDSAFIDEDELRRVDITAFPLPELALCLNTFAVLFGGMDRLFLRRRPICLSTIQSHVIPISMSWWVRRSS
jgi:hypothetical protein